ncbi:MAG: hypothetical protein Q7S43_02910 [bacterium]|nr:hypothetical protein [bacterium]MDO8496380.1 hypothetical protein [bacterium]
MEKGFRTFQCHGCPAKLKISVSEKDYGTTKTVRCPKCQSQSRLEIPRPATETSKTKEHPWFGNTNPFSLDFFGEDIFGDIFKGNKK